jgi:hypothetical protein
MRSQPYLRGSAADITSSSPLHFDHPDHGYRYVEASQEQHHRHNHNMMPGMPGEYYKVRAVHVLTNIA